MNIFYKLKLYNLLTNFILFTIIFNSAIQAQENYTEQVKGNITNYPCNLSKLVNLKWVS